MRTFALRGNNTKQGGYEQPQVAANPYVVSHGKNIGQSSRNSQYGNMFEHQQVSGGDNMMPSLGGTVVNGSGRSRPGTSAQQGRPPIRQNNGLRPNTAADINQRANGWTGANADASQGSRNGGQNQFNTNPMFGNRSRKAKEDQAPAIDINDTDFYYNTDPAKESIVEQNMYQIMHDHRDCMKAKCLEVKPPVIKKSIYNKDFVPFDRDEPIRGDANSAQPPYKPFLPMDTDTLYGVSKILI